jgi:hypothetical protein
VPSSVTPVGGNEYGRAKDIIQVGARAAYLLMTPGEIKELPVKAEAAHRLAFGNSTGRGRRGNLPGEQFAVQAAACGWFPQGSGIE